MAEHWQVDTPQVIDVGGDLERVHKVVVAVVGGHVDVVAQRIPPGDPEAQPAPGAHGARVEVSEVSGLPLHISWNGSTLKILHGKEAEVSVIDSLKRLVGAGETPTARVSVSVPEAARVSVSTISAAVVAAGLRRGLSANTVSGDVTVDDVGPELSLNTVSGDAVCADVQGEASINTVSGEVSVHASALRLTKVNTMSGDVTLDLRDRAAVVRSNSVSGDVTVRAPFIGYAVSASTMSGQVVVDGTTVERTGQSGTRTARFGDEALVLKASSLSGDLVVLRSDDSAAERAEREPTRPETDSTAGPQDRIWPEPTPAPQDAVAESAEGRPDEASA